MSIYIKQEGQKCPFDQIILAQQENWDKTISTPIVL